jgi:hypothetical protein
MKPLALIVLIALVASCALAQVNPVPLVNLPLVPDTAAPLGHGFTLTVNGTGFVPGSVVNWNGAARATTFVSSSRLTATVLSSDITTAATASVTVISPAPGGGTSEAVYFPISNQSSGASFNLFSSPTTGTMPDTVAVADLNGDGIPDIMTVNEGNLTVSVLVGSGGGVFAPAVDYSTGTEGIAVGDFNGDGILDMVVGGTGTTVSVLLGNGDGTFGPFTAFNAGGVASDVAVGDFNGDGKLDIAVSNANDDTVSILLGNGDGTFQTPRTFPACGQAEFVAVGDFNGDGRLDLAIGDAYTLPEGAAILLGNGDGTFQPCVLYPAGSTPQSLAVADLNGDGILDLAVGNFGSGNVSILLGKGDGTFQAAVNYSVGDTPADVSVGDFNNDGKLDIATTGEGQASILLGNGDGTFQPATTFAVGAGSAYLAVADFNQDGKLDLVTANEGPSTVSVMLQTVAPAVVLSPSSVAFATQLVGTASAAKTITLTNNGTAALTSVSVAASGNFAQTNTCSPVITVNASCTISVTFDPTKPGERTGAITVTDNAPNNPQTVSLTGTGTVVSLTPTRLNFGDVLVGATSPAKTVTLANTGSTTLTITSITSSGTGFAQTNTCPISPATLAAGATCTISATFTPAAAGAATGSISVSDSGGGHTQTVTVSGSGTLVELTPARLNFGSEPVGTTSPAKTVTLTNTGATPLSITSIALGGADPGDFAITADTCPVSPATLAAGAQCRITLKFTPTATGPREANLSVSDGGGGSPQAVSLSGTGE